MKKRSRPQLFKDLKGAIAANDVAHVVAILNQEEWLVNRVSTSDERSCLCEAVANGFLDVARVLVKEKANVNGHCIDGNTPLTTAVQCSKDEMVAFLLQQPDIDVDLANFDETPLQIAKRRGFKAIDRQLSEASASVDKFVKKEGGLTRRARFEALKKAVEKKDVDASLSILQHDSSLVNLPSTEFIGTSSHRQPHAISLLGKAVLAGCLEIAELLIEAKANVNQTFTGDCSQLYLVYRNEEMFALLLAHPDIDVRVVDDCRSTVLHGTESVFYAAAFRQLLAANAPVDFVDDRGDTAFTILYFDPLAAELESEEEILDITRVLLEYNVNVNYQDPEGFCVLNRAAQYGHSTVVAALLEANASADVATWNGDTPLMGVGGEHNVSDSPECVQLLVAAGANVNATNKHGMTPLFFAGCRGHPLSTAVLLQAGATVAGDSKALQESLFRASFVGQLGFVKAVLRLRRRGGNALDDYRAHDWSEQGTPQECISLLLDAKLDINQTLTNGQPLLIWTIENEGYNETKLLLANGANRYCHDRSGRSSRQLAAHRSCSSLFECKMCVWRPLCCLPCRKEWCRVECERELVDPSSNCSLSADCRWYRKLAHQSVVQWAIAMSPLQFPPYVLEHIFNWLDFGYNPTRKARDHYERIATKRIAATRNVHPPLRINENYIHLMIEERSHSQNIKLFIAVHRAYRKTAVQTWQQ